MIGLLEGGVGYVSHNHQFLALHTFLFYMCFVPTIIYALLNFTLRSSGLSVWLNLSYEQ